MAGDHSHCTVCTSAYGIYDICAMRCIKERLDEKSSGEQAGRGDRRSKTERRRARSPSCRGRDGNLGRLSRSIVNRQLAFNARNPPKPVDGPDMRRLLLEKRKPKSKSRRPRAAIEGAKSAGREVKETTSPEGGSLSVSSAGQREERRREDEEEGGSDGGGTGTGQGQAAGNEH